MHCVLLGQKFFMDQTFLIEKCNRLCFHLRLRIRAFFGLASPSPTHYILWRLVSGSYSKSDDSSQVITHLRIFSDSIASSQSRQTSTRRFLCSLVRFFRTSLVHSFRRCNSSFIIKRMVSRLINSSSATSLMDKRRSKLSSCFTRSTLEGVRVSVCRSFLLNHLENVESSHKVMILGLATLSVEKTYYNHFFFRHSDFTDLNYALDNGHWTL